MDTPYYCIDIEKLSRNMVKIARLREISGAKALLALKCFATHAAFPYMRPFMDGTTSSSLFELKLGREEFGGETHAYSVAWADHEIDEALTCADKIIFNSLSQLERFGGRTKIAKGLRLNPGFSSSSFDLADPARPFSRLGEWDPARIETAMPQISGFMVHNNCENADFDRLSDMLDRLEANYGRFFDRVEWLSLGGGIHFTGEDYPLEALARRLKSLSTRFGVQIYLEPGEAAITNCTTLELSVLDLLDNGKNLAITDGSVEAHILDLLIYRQAAKLPQSGEFAYQICGKSCLAGDIFGEARFEAPLRVGDRISVSDAAGYTMVKKNWFNGVAMPAIVLREPDGSERLIRRFEYSDYRAALS